jgi:hypothetical protein
METTSLVNFQGTDEKGSQPLPEEQERGECG